MAAALLNLDPRPALASCVAFAGVAAVVIAAAWVSLFGFSLPAAV